MQNLYWKFERRVVPAFLQQKSYKHSFISLLTIGGGCGIINVSESRGSIRFSSSASVIFANSRTIVTVSRISNRRGCVSPLSSARQSAVSTTLIHAAGSANCSARPADPHSRRERKAKADILSDVRLYLTKFKGAIGGFYAEKDVKCMASGAKNTPKFRR